MGRVTLITWCDHTLNSWRGCAKVSAGCTNCFAERQAKRSPKVLGTWGPNGHRVIASEDYWRQPIRWNEEAAKLGIRRRVFVGSMMDVFEDRDELNAPRVRLFNLIHRLAALDWLLLTKRPENVLRMVPDEWHHDWPAHVWLGTSVEDQDAADKRIPALLEIPAAIRFLSIEPLLGPVDLSGLLLGIHWIICGAESGPHRRPCNLEWVHSIVNQCLAAKMPVFVKQIDLNGEVVKDMDRFPGPLRLQQFPT